MIKHVVMWKLGEQYKLQNMQKIKSDLEALNDLDCVHKIEVGFDNSNTDFSYDLVLVSEFSDQANFDEYKIHPEHQKIVRFMKTVVKARTVVDYWV